MFVLSNKQYFFNSFLKTFDISVLDVAAHILFYFCTKPMFGGSNIENQTRRYIHINRYIYLYIYTALIKL